MLGKKQVITMVSIAVVSFLFGTTFNVISMAVSGGNPFNEIWEAISDLEGRVTSVEEDINQAKTIRFVDPTEYTQSAQDSASTPKENATIFVWTPNNSSNNAILSIAFYCETKAEWEIGPPILEATLKVSSGYSEVEIGTVGTVSYTRTTVIQSPHGGTVPNQDNYTIWIEITSLRPGVLQDYKVYFRNFNIILTVADGVSPEYVTD